MVNGGSILTREKIYEARKFAIFKRNTLLLVLYMYAHICMYLRITFHLCFSEYILFEIHLLNGQ